MSIHYGSYSSNTTDWRCSSAGSALGCSAAFSRVWFESRYSDFFLYFTSFLVRDVIYTGCANKKQFLRKKFIISVTVIDFFTKFTAFTEKDSHHIRSKFRHNIYYGLKITTI